MENQDIFRKKHYYFFKWKTALITYQWLFYSKNSFEAEVTFNVLCAKNKERYPGFVWKHNLKRERQITLLVIPNGKGWHYIVVKKITRIIKKNNIKTWWWWRLFELSSFVWNKTPTQITYKIIWNWRFL